MSNLTSRHTLVAWETYPRVPQPSRPSPMRDTGANLIDVEPAPLSGREMALIVAVSLPAFVLAFHLVALASGGVW